MKETIVTIPISEVFEPLCGCPVCRMKEMLRERILDYIMGAAMMEPDVRIETNRLGFCASHYAMMLTKKNRLSLALMLESRLSYVTDMVKKGKTGSLSKTCFICDSMDKNIDTLLKNTVTLWRKEQSFRELFAKTPELCLPHFELLIDCAKKSLPKKEAAAFTEACSNVFTRFLSELSFDVSSFCKSFDYRAGSLTEGAKTSVERAVAFLEDKST